MISQYTGSPTSREEKESNERALSIALDDSIFEIETVSSELQGFDEGIDELLKLKDSEELLENANKLVALANKFKRAAEIYKDSLEEIENLEQGK